MVGCFFCLYELLNYFHNILYTIVWFVNFGRVDFLLCSKQLKINCLKITKRIMFYD